VPCQTAWAVTAEDTWECLVGNARYQRADSIEAPLDRRRDGHPPGARSGRDKPFEDWRTWNRSPLVYCRPRRSPRE